MITSLPYLAIWPTSLVSVPLEWILVAEPMCALRKAAMCLCTWQLFLAQAEQLPGALLHHAARPACLLGTRVTTFIPPNCPCTNTLPVPHALLADLELPVGCESV